MDLDAVLPDVGEFGAYQQLLLWLVLLPGVLPCGFHAYNQIFMAARPQHWCRVPELEALANVSVDLVKNISLPREMAPGGGRFSQCLMFQRNYSALAALAEVLGLGGGGGDGEEEVGAELAAAMMEAAANLSTHTVNCQHGWTFDDSHYTGTVVTEWALVCEKDFLPTLALVLLGAGGLVGSIIFGYVQDGLGRRPAFFSYLFIQCVFGIATAFAPNFTIWAIIRFGVGLTVPATLTAPYVLVVELVGPSKRSACSVLTNVAYSFGLMSLSGVAFLARDWRQLALGTALPFLSFFLYWRVLPESPRWLLARGRFDKFEAIFRTMARVNGRKLPSNYMEQLRRKFQCENYVFKKENERRYGVLDLMRTQNLRRKTIVITFIWFTITSVYVGLSYYSPSLGGDDVRNFFLASAVELPIYLLLWPLVTRCGRRWMLCITMLVSGSACVATLLCQHDSTVTLVLFCVGKMAITGAFVVLPLFASELYPTVVRGLGISMSSVIGNLGPALIPLVNYLGEQMLVLPLLVMGGLLLVGGVCALLLPETLHQHLPQTLEDGESFGSSLGWRDWISCTSPRIKPEGRRLLSPPAPPPPPSGPRPEREFPLTQPDATAPLLTTDRSRPSKEVAEHITVV